MEYMIVSAGDPLHFKAIEALAREVNKAIAEGWQPQGNHAVVYDPKGGFRASQAMISHKDEYED